MLSHELVPQYQLIPESLKSILEGDGFTLPEFEPPDPERLKGFRAVVVVAHGVELPEFHVPLVYLRDRGASVEVVTPDWLFKPSNGSAVGLVALAQFLAVNVCVQADKKISDARIEDYDAVVILGGAWNPVILRTDEKVQQFIAAAHERRMLIAAICHGPQVLISANVFPPSTRLTGVEDIRQDLGNAKFAYEEKLVVFDEEALLITSPNPEPDALKAFCEEIGKYAQRLVAGRT